MRWCRISWLLSIVNNPSRRTCCGVQLEHDRMVLDWGSARPTVCLRLLVALHLDGSTASCALNWPINGCRFLAWVTQLPIFALRLDKLDRHQCVAERQAIGNTGVHLLLYSPDPNPIEMVLSRLKTLLRKADNWWIATVRHRTGSLLQQSTPTRCANCVSHAG